MSNEARDARSPQLSRRSFTQLLGGAAILGLVDPLRAQNRLFPDPRRISWHAHKTAGGEGCWQLQVEGEIPAELRGTMFRTAPGESERFGVTFNHLFDGDTFVSGWSFADGKAWLRARFLPQPERIEERQAGKMLFSEFGTMAESDGRPRYKNQPSVNLIAWDGRLLGLSEGGMPTAIDPHTLDFQQRWNFHRSLPGPVTFTAHPRLDPATGVGFGFGIARGPGMPLCVYRMNPGGDGDDSGKLEQLWRLPQRGFPMIHDMVLAGDHLVFVIPPVTYDLGQLMSGEATPGQALRYAEQQPMRLLILRKDGQGEPVECTLPPGMVYHHGNGFERDGKLVFDSLLYPDGDILHALNDWSKERTPAAASARLTRITIDLESGAVSGRDELAEDCEYPRFDERHTGREARWLWGTRFTDAGDPHRADLLEAFDLGESREGRSVTAAKDEMLGEPVFVARAADSDEGDGFVLNLVYQAGKDRSGLEIRDARSLERLARVWAPTHLPLGFHGNFSRDLLVARPDS